ncbi:unnamed protein product [Rhizopus microsporus]|uniref:Uncharacterized protein n=1 Tax=Rhizopus microsporus TaxID=58291 RepID=A0A0A1NFA2_RHIZD|nr:hypothetical protein BCV71DRAFT_266190 [Rhizopus microsporus]CEI95530.1 hypothetical protein RMCBS344292_09713 [Rhizopus microsporus]
MAQALKEMMCALYQKSPDALCEIALVSFLFFVHYGTVRLSPINHTKAVDLSEEPDDLCSELFQG